jgi:hypothetical protein
MVQSTNRILKTQNKHLNRNIKSNVFGWLKRRYTCFASKQKNSSCCDIMGFDVIVSPMDESFVFCQTCAITETHQMPLIANVK